MISPGTINSFRISWNWSGQIPSSIICMQWKVSVYLWSMIEWVSCNFRCFNKGSFIFAYSFSQTNNVHLWVGVWVSANKLIIWKIRKNKIHPTFSEAIQLAPQGVHIFPWLFSFESVGGWVSFQLNIVRLRRTVRKNGLSIRWAI